MQRMRHLVISYCVLAVIAFLGVIMIAGLASIDWSNNGRPLVIFAPRQR